MIRLGTSGRTRQLALVEASPLRRADPRTKLALCLCASLAVMLPLERLAAFMVIYTVLLLWARLLPEAARQAWRLKWVLSLLFLGDWLLVGLDLAVIITLRLILLAGVFALFFATTTPSELRLALEWLQVPYRSMPSASAWLSRAWACWTRSGGRSARRNRRGAHGPLRQAGGT